MISRRNFFTITLIMLVLLFMFQAPEVIKDRMNNYDVNTYAEEPVTNLNAKTAVQSVDVSAGQMGRHVVYIGNTREQLGTTVKQWCMYSKRYLEAYGRLRMYTYHARRRPEAVIIDSGCLDVDRDIGKLTELTKRGVHIIFCGLPNLKKLKGSMELKSLMGIRGILFDKIRVQGIHLFDSLLFGGEKIYKLDEKMEKSQQDLDLVMPWCQIASGTKAYMVGMLGNDVKNEELPAVIWRNSVGQSRIFVVGSQKYLRGSAGPGFFEGMLYETKAYALYPIVNAQNLVVLNYPTVASENEETMMQFYSRPLEAVYRDLVWPGLSVTAEKSKKKLTCMISPQQDYKDDIEPDSEALIYYMKLLREKRGEAGLSASIREGKGLDDKMKRDKVFLDEAFSDYKFVSFYQAKLSEEELSRVMESALLKNVRTVLADYDSTKPLIGYQSKNVTKQYATSSGYSHTFMEDICMNSIQTALGYSSIAVDLNKIAYPASKRDSWEKLYDSFSSNINTYWKAYENLDATTLAESDVRIRRFLALDYAEEQTENVISLSVQNLEEEAFFVLRLKGNYVEKIQGAEYELLQDGVYLLRVLKDKVYITFRDGTDRTFFH